MPVATPNIPPTAILRNPATHDLGIHHLNSAFATGELTPSQLVCQLHPELSRHGSIFIRLASLDELLASARVLEAMSETQRHSKPLWGCLFAVKDNVDVCGWPTTAGCPSFSYTPVATAPAVQALIDAGAILVGKTNMDQFAAGLVGTRSPFGVPTNPFDSRFLPGGSSSGSGAAVGWGLVSFAVGTDTAGSGRMPAGLCGCVGMKGTLGSISTVGVVPACASLDCLTVFARSVQDGATLMCIMRTASTAADVWRRIPMQVVPPPLTGFRFAVPNASLLDWSCPGGQQAVAACTQQFDAAIERMQGIGGVLVDMDFGPLMAVASMLYGASFVAERYSGLRTFLESGGQGGHEEALLAAAKKRKLQGGHEQQQVTTQVSHFSEDASDSEVATEKARGGMIRVNGSSSESSQLNTRIMQASSSEYSGEDGPCASPSHDAATPPASSEQISQEGMSDKQAAQHTPNVQSCSVDDLQRQQQQEPEYPSGSAGSLQQQQQKECTHAQAEAAGQVAQRGRPEEECKHAQEEAAGQAAQRRRPEEELERQQALVYDRRLLPVTSHILAGAGKFTATNVYDHLAVLARLRVAAMAELQKADCLLVPTALCHYTIQEIAAEEEATPPSWPSNAKLGRFTNFVNLLDMCGVAVPSGLVRLDAVAAAGEAEAALQAGQISAVEAAAVRERAFHLAQTGATRVVLPFGVTLLAGAWKDEWLASVAQKMQEATGLGCGPEGHGLNEAK